MSPKANVHFKINGFVGTTVIRDLETREGDTVGDFVERFKKLHNDFIVYGIYSIVLYHPGGLYTYSIPRDNNCVLIRGDDILYEFNDGPWATEE